MSFCGTNSTSLVAIDCSYPFFCAWWVLNAQIIHQILASHHVPSSLGLQCLKNAVALQLGRRYYQSTPLQGKYRIPFQAQSYPALDCIQDRSQPQSFQRLTSSLSWTNQQFQSCAPTSSKLSWRLRLCWSILPQVL
jgi:hypothetical protein